MVRDRPLLGNRLALETRGGGLQTLTLDLSGLTHLASDGVQLLQETRRGLERPGGLLHLLAAPGSVAHYVLDLVAVPHDTKTADHHH